MSLRSKFNRNKLILEDIMIKHNLKFGLHSPIISSINFKKRVVMEKIMKWHINILCCYSNGYMYFCVNIEKWRVI